jgi:ribosomal protein S4E
MGLNTTKQLIEISEDEAFTKELHAQVKQYQEINHEAKALLASHGYDEKGINALDKIKIYVMINMQTLKDKSTSHLAEMILLGSNMGVIDAIKNIKRYQEAEKDILTLMKKLQRFEESNVEKMKAFL